jgi:hypothetical protein
MKKKGKAVKIFEYSGDFNFLVSYELRTIEGNALDELVKCKSSKTYFQSNLPEKSGHIRFPDRVPEKFSRYVRPVDRTYPV